MNRKHFVSGILVVTACLVSFGLAIYLTRLDTFSVSQDGGSSTLKDLPLTELPVQNSGDLMAIIWSGDGGWRDLDKTIGERFQSLGIPVVGVDCLRYFWHEKSPAQVARDLGSILRHYQDAWQRQRVILVGYSFGADVMPFAVNRLPEDLKQDIVRISLLGPALDAVFVIDVKDQLLNTTNRGSRPILPEVAQLQGLRVQCVYGEEEESTACTAHEFDQSERIMTKGGHHFDRNYDALADRILSGTK